MKAQEEEDELLNEDDDENIPIDQMVEHEIKK
jgi:hypothetical protein